MVNLIYANRIKRSLGLPMQILQPVPLKIIAAVYQKIKDYIKIKARFSKPLFFSLFIYLIFAAIIKPCLENLSYYRFISVESINIFNLIFQ